MKKTDISVIIPVFNEQKRINQAIDALYAQKFDGKIEIIVVDGHQKATTLDQITDQTVVQVTSVKGRGNQMNAGVRHATGRILLFLHCDTRLPDNAFAAVCKALSRKTVAAGAFDLAINGTGRAFRIVEKTASLRSRLTRIPYGDQAIFIQTSCFLEMGGYADLPIMEDVDLMLRLKKQHVKIHILDLCVLTSARRWQQEGLVSCTLRNWAILTLFFCGVRPQTLVRFYAS